MESKSTVDPSVLLDAIDGDMALAAELVELFFQESGKEFEGLRHAVLSKRAEDVVLAAHKLAGSALACGLVSVAGDLKKLEQLAKEGMPPDANDRILQIESGLDEAQCFFKAYFEGNLLE